VILARKTLKKSKKHHTGKTISRPEKSREIMTHKIMNLENQMKSAARHLRKEMSEIPGQMLRHSKGIVFLTMVKGAFIWSASLSTGIVIKRISPTQWSPPCSVGMASVGFGLQAGGEKVDIIIVIADDQEIDTFTGTGQLKLGVEYGLAAGVRERF
jgi:lipid-binding SYLF domain-containing protein